MDSQMPDWSRATGSCPMRYEEGLRDGYVLGRGYSDGVRWCRVEMENSLTNAHRRAKYQARQFPWVEEIDEEPYIEGFVAGAKAQLEVSRMRRGF